MNIESFEFALVTAGVGMGIVFFALIVLSVMMLVIRALFRDRLAVDTAGSGSTGGGERTGGGADRAEPGPDEVDESGVPRWVLAGAVTYLLQEEQERAPWAAPWTTRPVRQ